MGKVVIILGSKSDLIFAEKISNFLKKFSVSVSVRIGSAHKVPLKVLDIIKEEGEDSVFITIAGRSNALSAFVDWHTNAPVIACPPYSEKFSGADIFSSLSMPSYVSPMVVLDPENAAFAALKILARGDEELTKKILEFKNEKMNKLQEEDLKVKGENR